MVSNIDRNAAGQFTLVAYSNGVHNTRSYSSGLQLADSHAAAASFDAAKLEHKRCQERLEEIKNGIARHIAYVEERELRHLSIKELEGEAVKAILDGYHDGLAANRGHVIGTRRDQ